jgi:nicotinate dehydrogenase subunit A
MALGEIMASFEVNGQLVTVHQNDQTPLIDALRNELGLRATRLGCGLGQCGACHVMVDGQSVPACDTPLWAVQDKQVMTAESAKGPHQDAARRVLRQLQDAFVQEQAAQCGFCTSGILMSATVLLQQHAEPSLAQIHDALDRHLCRCGAHLRIVRAIQRASKALREEVTA